MPEPLSFGRPTPPSPPPSTPVPAVQPRAGRLEVDVAPSPQSLIDMSRLITEVVIAAVRAGYATAVADLDREAEDADNFNDPGAAFDEKLEEFVVENNELLERIASWARKPEQRNG